MEKQREMVSFSGARTLAKRKSESESGDNEDKKQIMLSE